MSAKPLILVAIAVVIGLSVFAWVFLSGEPAVDSAPPAAGLPAGSADRAANSEAPHDLDGTQGTAAGAGGQQPAETAAAEREAIDRTGLYIAGRVTDKVSGEPVTGFHVWLLRQIPADPDKPDVRPGWKSAFREDIFDPDGNFFVPLEQGGRFRLHVHSPCHLPETLDDVVATEDTGPIVLDIQLDPGLSVAGRVVDDATAEPVADALIGTTDDFRTNLDAIRTAGPLSQIHTRSDVEGRFRLGGLSEKRQKIVAVHDDYAEAWAEVLPAEAQEIEIRLKGGPRIYGTVRDDAGNLCPGVTVECYSNNTPLPRPAVSGPEGEYCTGPLHAGLVELQASQSSAVDNKQVFSGEWKYTEIADSDVRVDFGPSPDYVSWRGTLYGPDDLPVPGAGIFIRNQSLDLKLRARLRLNRHPSYTDEAGAFAFSKLQTGTYSVSVYVEDGAPNPTELSVVLETPGTVEKDIHLAPCGRGIVRGVVIDGASNLPFVSAQKNRYCTATLFAHYPAARSYTASVDEHSRFEFTGLPPGQYFLSAAVRGRPYSGDQEIRVEPDAVIENVRIVIPPGGKLFVRVTGFRQSDPQRFDLVIAPEQGRPRGWSGRSLDANGSWEQTFDLEPGVWTIGVSGDTIGGASKQCRVEAGRTGEVVFHRDELIPPGGAVSLAGTLTRDDGSPVPGKTLTFGYRMRSSFVRASNAPEAVSGRTDEEGRFSIPGFTPGIWRARADLAHGVRAAFRDILIPPNPCDPYPAHLVLPGGTITGRLIDASTGRPLVSSSAGWWVYAIDTDRNMLCEVERSGSDFELPAIPACRCSVQVSVRGYLVYTSPALDHPGAGNIDLGAISLSPCGVLELTVRDFAGEDVTTFTVRVNGQEALRWVWLPGGGSCYDKIALGPATVTVGAPGFKTYETEVDFKAGMPVRLEVVLERR